MEKSLMFGFSVDDIGLDGYSSEKHLNQLLDFCDKHRVKATLFAVPDVEGKRMDKRSGYVAILRDAIQRGHEVAQHGLQHERFEIGIPPEMIMILPHEGPARKFLAENRHNLAAEHSVEKIRTKLRLGREILENAIGKAIKGFRAPSLQSCTNMFIALAEENYEYDSSTCLQEAGWDLLNNIDYVPREITRTRFFQMQKSANMNELPLTTDYVWYLKEEKFDRALALAIHDYEACVAAAIPFVPVCHVSPIFEGDDDLGFEFYRCLFAHMTEHSSSNSFAVKSMTLDEINQSILI